MNGAQSPSGQFLEKRKIFYPARGLTPNNPASSYDKSQRDALFHKFILVKNSTCFGQIYCPSSGVFTL